MRSLAGCFASVLYPAGQHTMENIRLVERGAQAQDVQSEPLVETSAVSSDDCLLKPAVNLLDGGGRSNCVEASGSSEEKEVTTSGSRQSRPSAATREGSGVLALPDGPKAASGRSLTCHGPSHAKENGSMGLSASLVETPADQPPQSQSTARRKQNADQDDNTQPAKRRKRRLTTSNREKSTNTSTKRKTNSASPEQRHVFKRTRTHKHIKLRGKRRRPPRKALIASSGSDTDWSTPKRKPVKTGPCGNLDKRKASQSNSDSDTEVETHFCSNKSCPGCTASTQCETCPHCRHCLECPHCRFCSGINSRTDQHNLLDDERALPQPKSRKRVAAHLKDRPERLVASSASESENDRPGKRLCSSEPLEPDPEEKTPHDCSDNVCAGCETCGKCESCPTCQKCPLCPNCQNCWGRPRRKSKSRKRPREPPRQFTALKIYGTHGYRTRFMFLRACRKVGIPITDKQITYFSAKGYRSETFDSRHILIAFKNPTIARRALTSLECAKGDLVRKWRSEATTIQVPVPQRPGSNRFAPLAVDDECEEEKRSQPAVNQLGSEANVCTWNCKTISDKMREIETLMSEKDLEVLTLTETRQTVGRDDPEIRGYQWFGRHTKSAARGGVGMFIANPLIHNQKVETFKGKKPDTFYVTISSPHSRATLIAVVYARSSLTNDELDEQWDSYSSDIRKIKRSLGECDIIFTGDINARFGRPRNELEEMYLGQFGEECRNAAGKRALQFFIDNDLVCLNGRDRERAVEYTYQSSNKRQEHYKSVIDVIAVSRSMYRRKYRASVCSDTVVVKQDHFPLISGLHLRRSKPREYPAPARPVWNTHLFTDSPGRMQDLGREFRKNLNRFYAEVRQQDTSSKMIETLSGGLTKAARNAGLKIG